MGGVKLPLALAELGLIDAYEFVVQPTLAGHRPTVFAGLAKHIDVKLVSRLAFASGAVALRYAPKRSPAGGKATLSWSPSLQSADARCAVYHHSG